MKHYERCYGCEFHFDPEFELYEHEGHKYCMECLRSEMKVTF